ncbi:CPBP family intramembrane glutamic endopeptidase [Paenibacillus crassostreae]|uniref:CAAX protease n=1 Tax=Paenibacillus crassostreae TaxID=1763538 RepID=A0A167EGH8_9BACL|nr:type II CAAX endopeptidase family protein [Paenibacillus crassostreae]AOZ92602.1 CAAX protease family protein [Paenibacillus crassostreae]OAB75529.1 CAAX protease [Paenibacillus crassostreae]
MSNPRNKTLFSQRRPVLTVVIIEVLLLLAIFVAGAYVTIKEINNVSPVLISFIPISLILIIYLTWRRKWHDIGFQSLANIPKRHWLLYTPLIVVLVVISLDGFKEVTVSEVFYFIFFTLLVGFVEETVYRGLILKTLLNKSIRVAVITSSILFSLTHLLNVMSGQSMEQTLLQLVYALVMGVVLALLMIKNANIWPLITFHFLHNLIQFLGNEQSTTLGYDIIVILILIIQCVWLMVSLKKQHVAG